MDDTHGALRGDDAWPWLTEHPVFTTHGERGGTVTRVPAGVTWDDTPTTLGREVAILSAGTAALALGVSMIVAGGAQLWWGIGIAALGLVVSVFFVAGVSLHAMELAMRERARGLVTTASLVTGVALGILVRTIWLIALTDETVGGFAAATGVLIVAAVVLALLAVSAVRRGRADVARILALRSEAEPVAGVVASLPDPATWSHGGDVRVTSGAHGSITARVNTTSDRIPVIGTPVTVFTDASGDILIELDPSHPVSFLADYAAYETGNGGGGS